MKSDVAYMVVGKGFQLCAVLDIPEYAGQKLSDQPDQMVSQLLDLFVASKGESATLGVFIDALKFVHLIDLSELLEKRINDYENTSTNGRVNKLF